MIQIQSFATAKENSLKNATSNSSTTNNTTTIISGVNGVRLWGQYHDHTKDIDGDMSNVGNIYSNGTISTSGNVIANQIQGTTVTSEHVVATDAQIGSLTGGTIHTTGSITTDENINAVNGYFENELITDYFEAVDANIGNLLSNNLVCDNLTVTNAAHFFKLVIDEIKASKGQIIVTPANAKIDKVVQDNDTYNLYFRAYDGTTKIHNMFEVGDQILCQTFDVAEGTSYNISNKFYWAKCTYVSPTPVYTHIDGNTVSVQCHVITLDWTDKHPSTNAVPEAGDEVVMLGNRTDTQRQAAISIGAYNNPYLDNTIKAPFIIQYQGINDYNLSTHRGNVISNGYNSFKGVFTTTTGDNIEDLIDDVGQGAMTYMHTAYANSANGQQAFSKTYFANALYIGFCSNHNQSDAGLTYQDYTWCRLKGSDGTSATSFFLQSDTLSISVDENNETTVPDFYVYGYTFDNNDGKTQVNYNCDVTYVYADPIDNTTTTRQLPILISPYQDEQALANGLKIIRFEMYDANDENIVAQLDIPILRDGESGYDGDDAVQYKLIPIQESAYIDANGKVGVKLSYNILRIVGSQYDYVTTSSTGYHVGFKAHKTLSTSSSWTYLPYNTTNPSYINANYATNWNTSQDHLEWLEVCLLYGEGDPQIIGDDEVVDRRIVYAQLLPSATFTITDEIKSVVQGHTTAINSLDGRITTNTNSISTIQQQYNQISSTVQSHTTSIDNLTGRVTANETNISNITQRADSIESTVQHLKSGVKNYFNFTNCRFYNAVPFIKAYGIEGKGSTTRIYKLGFDGVGGDFSVSCFMRMKNSAATVNVNLCNVNDANQPTVNVTTTWNYYQFTFKNVQDFIGNAADTQNNNGMLDFESTGIDNTNRLYVKDLMIVRGNIPCDFNPSWKDVENANSDNIVNWTLDPRLEKTDEKYKGYDVYTPTTYSWVDGEWIDYIYSNNVWLKSYTPYTLSFYAKSQNPSTIEAFLNGNGGCVDGTCTMINTIDNEGDISISNFSDGCTQVRLGSNWKHYIIHWYNYSANYRNIIVYRDSIDNWDDPTEEPFVSICGVEFHEGYWDENQLNSQSMIRQTATEIELKVNNTGINIYDNSITLNAENTTIIGNLNLKDPKQGLIIYDEYDNPKITIQNETIGTLDNFDFGADKLYRSKTTSNVNSLTYNVTFPTITLGQYYAGQKLQLHDMVVSTFNQEHVFDTSLTSLTYNYTIKCGTTTITTQNGSATKLTWDYAIPDYTNNSLPYTGTYTIELAIQGRTTANYLGYFNHSLYLYARTIQTNINKVAIDGAVFASSTTQYNWMGSDQTMIRNGASALRLKDGKIQRNGYNTNNPSYNNTFSDLSTTLPYRIVNSLTHTATVDDGMIAFSTVIGQTDGATRTIYLPNPTTCAGKQFFVKNMVGNSTQAYVTNASSNDKYFIPHDSNGLANNISFGNRSVIFISCGFYWVTFRCG